MNRKIWVLDTNIVIHNPSILNEISNTEIVLPIIVLEELDSLKGKETVGYKVRKFFNNMKINGLTAIIDKGITFGDNNIISTTLEYNLDSIPDCLDRTYGDNKILALNIFKDKEATLITQDYSMAIKARAMGISVQYYAKSNNKKLSEMQKGYVEMSVDDDVIDYFYSKGSLDRNALIDVIPEPNPNMFVLAKGVFDPKKSFIAKFKKGRWVKLEYADKSVYGIKAKDAQQKMALELLLDDDVRVVTLTGSAGVGKTLLALAVALHEVIDKDKYDCAMIGKNTAPLDKWSYQGFAPGTVIEKLMTHFGNYTSNLEHIHNLKTTTRRERMSGEQVMVEYMEQLKAIQMLDISSILGSSFQNKFIIVDEAQSFTFDSMRAIITRVGEGSKMVILGDVLQMTIDKLDIDKSGLFFVVENLKDLAGVGHITLENVHRSKVVDEIAKKFDELV